MTGTVYPRNTGVFLNCPLFLTPASILKQKAKNVLQIRHVPVRVRAEPLGFTLEIQGVVALFEFQLYGYLNLSNIVMTLFGKGRYTMPKLTNQLPKKCNDRGRAFSWHRGKRIYHGVWGSPEADKA